MKATLLSNNGAPVWKIGNEIVTGVSYESIRFPGSCRTICTTGRRCCGRCRIPARGAIDVEASYLASESFLERGLCAQRRDGRVERRPRRLGHAGQSQRHSLQECLAATGGGRSSPSPCRQERIRDEMKAMDAAAAAAKRARAIPAGIILRISPLFPEPADIDFRPGDRSRSACSTLRSFPLRKVYVVNGQNLLLPRRSATRLPVKDPVRFSTNSRMKRRPGSACRLPAGTIRVYQQDSRGGSLFVGEDHIDHTPKGRRDRLHIGNAFDIVAERKQTDYKKIADRLYEIRVRDHAAQSQGRPNLRRSERADRRRLGNPFFHLSGKKDRGLRRAIPCAGEVQWRIRPEIPYSRPLVRNSCPGHSRECPFFMQSSPQRSFPVKRRLTVNCQNSRKRIRDANHSAPAGAPLHNGRNSAASRPSPAVPVFRRDA